MSKSLKIFHVLGLVMFLGSIVAMIVVNQGHPAGVGPEQYLFARKAIYFTTSVVTMPGLYLLIVSGVGMVIAKRMWPLPTPWLLLKAVFAGLILVNAQFLVVPIGKVLAGAAGGVVLDEFTRSDLAAIENREHYFGSVNVVLTLLAIGLAVFRPQLSARGKDRKPLDAR